MKEPVPDFVGDVVRYLDLDPRSERFEIRRRIINGAVQELKVLLSDSEYDKIIILLKDSMIFWNTTCPNPHF